jgi:simple sugar transport system ATP-binding protein
VNTKEAVENIRRTSAEYGLEVDPEAVIENLPIGMQQRVEILKALDRNAEILILDEPTAVLTPQEIDALRDACDHCANRANQSSSLPTNSKKSWRSPTTSR